MQKKLVFIDGPMGIGKTTIGQRLVEQKLTNAAFLDGDWCWYMHPWVFNDENKQMVLKNIQYLLNSYLQNSTIKTIVFVWVMHQQRIVDDILTGLNGHYKFYNFSLVASDAELTNRFLKDVQAGSRQSADLAGTLERLPLYQQVDSIKIDVTGKTAAETTQQLHSLIMND